VPKNAEVKCGQIILLRRGKIPGSGAEESLEEHGAERYGECCWRCPEEPLYRIMRIRPALAQWIMVEVVQQG
jgi:hypothetical protein